MLLAEVARVSREVAETSARSRKTALLAELFAAAPPRRPAWSSRTSPGGSRRAGPGSAGARSAGRSNPPPSPP